METFGIMATILSKIALTTTNFVMARISGSKTAMLLKDIFSG